MKYPWSDNFLIDLYSKQAADPEDKPEDDGTNEPVDQPAEDTSTEDQPDPALAEDLTGDADMGGDTDLQAEIDDLKKQLEDLKKENDLEAQVDRIKRRLDNVTVQDDADTNDSIFQSASKEVNYVKRAIRRISSKIKNAGLTGAQQQLIITELDQHPQSSCQQIAASLASKLDVCEQDIFDFIRNSDYRFRHRHWRESSVIDWKAL